MNHESAIQRPSSLSESSIFRLRTQVQITAAAVIRGVRVLLVAVLLLWLMAALTACSSMSPETRAKWKATGAAVLGQVVKIAENVVINSAISAFDGQSKGNFLDSAAEGLRTLDYSTATRESVASVVKIWTPQDGPEHWTRLASSLAQTYSDAHPQTDAERAAVIEGIAKGLQLAAGGSRAE